MSYEYLVKNEMPDGPRSSYLASCFLEIDLAVTLLDLDLKKLFDSRNPILPIFFSES